MTNSTSQTIRQDQSLSQSQARPVSRTLQIVAAAFLGLSITYAVGFLPTAAAHNAAHDSRHSHAFPCH